MKVDREQYKKMINLCQKGKHKLRENSFGVVWCVRCGLLSTSVGNSQILVDEDKVLVE